MKIYHFHFRNDIPLDNDQVSFTNILHTRSDNIEGKQILLDIILNATKEIKNGRRVYHFYKVKIFDIGKNPFIVFCREDQIADIAETLCQLRCKSCNPFENYSFIKEHMYPSTDIDVSDKRNREYCTCNDKFVGDDEDVNTEKFLYKNIRLHKNFFVCDEGWFGFFYTKKRFDIVTRRLAVEIESHSTHN